MVAGIERERRFLVDGRHGQPWRNESEKIEIHQYYIESNKVHLIDHTLCYEQHSLVLLSEPEVEMFQLAPNWVFRLRSWNGDYIITGKSKISSDSAYELERSISKDTAHHILSNDYPTVHKTRYVFQTSEQKTWEIDEFEGRLAGLILAEIEFAEGQDIGQIPEWCSMEITHLKGWSNNELAKMVSHSL